jgi:hypothetical protein
MCPFLSPSTFPPTRTATAPQWSVFPRRTRTLSNLLLSSSPGFSCESGHGVGVGSQQTSGFLPPLWGHLEELRCTSGLRTLGTTVPSLGHIAPG